MISCAILERPGKWRIVGIAAGLLVALAPSITPLVTLSSVPQTSLPVFTTGFASLLSHSLAVALAVAILSVETALEHVALYHAVLGEGHAVTLA